MGFMTNVSPSPGRRPRGIPPVLWLTAGAVTAAGILVVMIDVLTTQSSASFGWFAYQPLASAAVFAGWNVRHTDHVDRHSPDGGGLARSRIPARSTVGEDARDRDHAA